MSQFVNDRDVFLDTQGNLNLDPRGGRHLSLDVDPAVFRVNAGGVGSPAAATFTVAAINLGGEITWSAPAGVILRGTGASTRTLSFAEMGADTVTIEITMEYMGEMYTDRATVSKIYDGSAVTTYTWLRYGTSAAGANFSDSPAGATYIGLAYNKTSAIESENPAEYQWVLIKGEDGIGVPGEPGADGQTLWTWIKYSDNADGTGLYDLPTDATVYIGIAANRVSPLESTIKGDYIWSRFKGGQGVPGNPGANGAPTFTWIKYASSAAGAAMSDSPDGKAYIGFAYNKPTPTESNIAGDYKWALLRGEDGVGVPGEPGADGVTLYTWLKYADAADGTGLYDTPNDNTVYIGIAVNRTTPAESNTKTDYVWSRFKGAPGVPGQDGAPGGAGPRGNVNISGTTPGNAWSDARAAIVLAEAGFGVPRAKDIVALVNAATGFIETRIFSGAEWLSFAQAFDGSLLVNGTVFTNALAADAVTTDKLAASAVTAGKLAADSVTARSVAAGAITATSLAIGNVDQVVPDSQMADSVFWGRPEQFFSVAGPVGFWHSNRILSFGPGYPYQDTFTAFFPVVRGGVYLFEYQVFMTDDYAGPCAVYAHLPGQEWLQMGVESRGYTFQQAGIPGGATTLVTFDENSAKGTRVPNAIRTINDDNNGGRVQFRIVTNVTRGVIQFGGFRVTRVMDGVLIADDAITAGKIRAKAITADKIAVDSLQAISNVVIGRSGLPYGTELDINGGRVYDTNGVRRFQFGNLDV